MSTPKVSDDIRQQAEAWFARRLEPAVREAESEAFERWRAQSPEHAQSLEQTEQLWDRLSVLKNSTRLRQFAVVDPVVAVQSASRRRLFHAIAASVLLAAVGVMTALFYNPVPPAQTLTTALGEQRTEALTDGTTLRINTGSALEVRMTESLRKIVLTRGEAAFDVAKDASRPFVVSAGDGTITAVGTHFQVRHEHGRVAVTLIEGRVQVSRSSGGEREWLVPGQQATFSTEASGIVRRNVDVQALTSWMGGRLEFRATPLEQAVAEVNRYSQRKLRIADPAIAHLEVSGTFRTGDIESVAAAFEAAFSVRAEARDDETVLLPR